MRRHLARFIAVGGALLLALGCARRDGGARDVLRISQRNEPATLDPQLASLPDEFFIIRALSEGLLAPAPDGGGPRPAVAARWQVSPDGRTYTFELRPDAHWSDGEPVTAADFVYSIRRVLSPKLAAPKASLFFPLRNAAAYYQGRVPDFAAVGARALDARRLELTLEQPVADFPAMVASGPWIPVERATIERFGRIDERATGWARPGRFVGNGPFLLGAWRPGGEIVVTRNPRYHDAARVHLREIRFVAFDNGDAEERAFRAGQLDVTMAVPFGKLDGYRQAQPAVLHTVPLFETRYLALNTRRPPLDRAEVRRALALALDRRELVDKVLRGGQEPAYSFVPPGLGGYQPAETIAENREEARRLLRAAGFPDGRGFPRLEMTTWVGNPALEAIQATWRRELGIEVALVQREARTHLAALVAGNYDLALATLIPDFNGASDAFTQLTTGNPGNYPHWSSAGYDQLVGDAGGAGPAEMRLADYRHAEKLLLDEAPVIPLYFNAQNYLQQPRVRHWRADRLWTRFYRDVEVGPGP
ncbi:MAG TPA: peptide ABC transporter substrate-binding protein [Lacunisphaera sp.]|nr:peptide ABC transporter substrate-binding protein [Lacunisphaera sp.]